MVSLLLLLRLTPVNFCRIWALAKKEVRKRMVLMPWQWKGQLTKVQFSKLVIESCEKVAEKHWKNVVHANRENILRYL